jgi:hypothetical protein
MQQHDFDALIYEKKKKKKLNMSRWEEIKPRYISTSPPYYQEEHEDEEF